MSRIEICPEQDRVVVDYDGEGVLISNEVDGETHEVIGISWPYVAALISVLQVALREHETKE